MLIFTDAELPLPIYDFGKYNSPIPSNEIFILISYLNFSNSLCFACKTLTFLLYLKANATIYYSFFIILTSHPILLARSKLILYFGFYSCFFFLKYIYIVYDA